MHGQHSEDTQQKWRMCSGPTQRSILSSEADSAGLKCFSKAGRKIGVGDTALFQAGDALPFIGIIRKVNAKEGALKLVVNWLYRPGDVKLGKGASLEVAPNEIFYSFHKDEIPAASLLHPCKVAFLPKGVELPTGVSSFVCRRVYDTSNKCLYWLTDQDYADEHQSEVDQLLHRTRHEMHTAAQSERPSQRATSELISGKLESANVAPGQGKSKKRERTDQTLDPSKRERHTKVEDSELKREVSMKFEDFATMANKEGGLANMSHVDQLVQAMAQERSDLVKKPADGVSRKTLLAGIIVATEREDCLTQFVRLGGVPVLDDWLQEAHKGKLGDGSYKEGDKGLEELLLTLLQALERLPVDLDALKTCIVGKSVNNLKSHRNSEIQKKARKLVDTWKKRVNAEMKSSDETKSALNSATTWSSKLSVETLASKGSFAGGSKSSASVQLATNGSGPSGDTIGNMSFGKEHSEVAVSKDNSGKGHGSGAGSEIVATVKEEKSCSSSQSQNNSQSWCSGSGKGVGSWKEEGKALSVVPVGNKTIGTALRSHTKSHPSTSSIGLQKEPSGRHKMTGAEKVSSALLPDKRAGEGARAEKHNSQRLIVRLPNPGRSPAHSTSGGLVDVGTANKGSPPNVMDRHPFVNGSSRTPDIHSPDTSGDTKCGNNTVCKEEVDRLRTAMADDTDNKPSERPKSLLTSTCPPVSDMSAVKKGCATSIVATDPDSSNVNPQGLGLDNVERGIDLLASVATCEGSEKSVGESMGGEGHPSLAESNKQGKDSHEPGSITQDYKTNGEQQRRDGPTCVGECTPTGEVADDKQERPSTSTLAKDQEEMALGAPTTFDCLAGASKEEVKANTTREGEPMEDIYCETLTKEGATGHEHESSSLTEECETATMSFLDNVAVLQEDSEDGSKGSSSPSSLTKAPTASHSALRFNEEDALEVVRQVAKEVEQEVQRYGQPEAQEASVISVDKAVPILNNEISEPKQTSLDDAGDASLEDAGGELNALSLCSKDGVNTKSDGEHAIVRIAVTKEMSKEEDQFEPSLAKDLEESQTTGLPGTSLAEASAPINVASLSTDRLCGNEDVGERPYFDLNKGLLTDEGLHDRSTHATNPSVLVPDRESSGFPIHLSSLAAPIAVVSATKGAFIPPSNLSRPKGELGWKGSAATSAFRPAEPRRMVETLQTPPEIIATDLTTTNQNVKPAWILDIDLNVADERVLEDASVSSMKVIDHASNRPPSRPELDLNRVDESDESTCLMASIPRGANVLPSRAMLDFDLNDGLGSEEAGVEEAPFRDKNFGSAGISTGLKPNSEFVNEVPWFSPTSLVPAAMVIPASSNSKSDSSFPFLTAPGVKPIVATVHNLNQYSGSQYRGVTPMSSSSVPYTMTIPTAFSHTGLPFGTGFPFTSSYNMSSVPHVVSTNSLPFPIATPSQLVSAGNIVPPFGRPYTAAGSVGEASCADPNSAWGRPCLDLNSGPDAVLADSDAKDNGGHGSKPTAGFSQLSYQQMGHISGTLKRKEPESGLDPFLSNFKQTAWREL